MRIYRVACLFWILMGSVATAQAQDWALDMFHRQTTHNFGTVARGAKAEYAFVVENIYKEDAHIASATSSCGCTRPSVTNNYIRTWQKAAVICSIDTTNFNGHREAAVTVRFDRPFPAEVILHVSVSIRSDVVVQPGEIDFGSVSQGARRQPPGDDQLCRSSQLGDRHHRDQQPLPRHPCHRNQPHRPAGHVRPDREPQGKHADRLSPRPVDPGHQRRQPLQQPRAGSAGRDHRPLDQRAAPRRC